MKIDMVLTTLAPIGGIEAALVALAKGLKDQDHTIRIFTIIPISKPNQNVDALRHAGTEIFSCPRLLYKFTGWLVQNDLRMINSILVLLTPFIISIAFIDSIIRSRSINRSIQGAAGRIRSWLRGNFKLQRLFYIPYLWKIKIDPPQIIHVHGWGCGIDPPGCLDTLKKYNIPIIYTEHNSPDVRIHETIADAPMNLATAIIAVSETGKEGLIKVGNATRPIFVIPYPVDPLTPYSKVINLIRPFTMICVARLHPQKGHQELIQAMAILKKEGFLARLLLVGDGPLRDEIKYLIEQFNLSDEISLIGAINRNGLPFYYSQADAAILYSYWEGQPLALIEALNLGMPLIVSDVGGNKELVSDYVNGIIIPPGEPTLLAEKIIALAKNKDLLDQMRFESKKVFDSGRFSPSGVTRLTLDVYRQCSGRW